MFKDFGQVIDCDDVFNKTIALLNVHTYTAERIYSFHTLY